MPSSKPTKVTVRTYKVGFGDCFLLSFHYGASDARHVLIDFGTNRLPEDATKGHMKLVAEQIKKDCGGKLQAVVATHRHKDHISGFATNKAGTASGDIIASCKPEIVIQPWTEDPDLDTDAVQPELAAHAHLRSALKEMQAFAASVDSMLPHYRSLGSAQLRELKFKGSNGLTNLSAVENLMQMGKRKPAYVKSGDPVDLSKELPGVKVTIFGPPALSEAGTLAYAASSPEYWLSVKNAWAYLNSSSMREAPADMDIPAEARWFVAAAERASQEESLGLVRILDSYLNNTSLILLFEAAGKKLLFPGDAQLENWSCALKKSGVSTQLKAVDLYKVGHHGSRNATPKKLWLALQKRGASTSPTRLRTVLSSMKGVYNDQFEVPRKALVDALKAESTLYDSEDIHGLCDKEPVTV